MKKTVLLIALLGLSYISEAQNTFPTTGNVGIGTVNSDTPIEIYKPSNNVHTDFFKITMPSWSSSINKNKSIVWDGGGNVITAGIGASYDGVMVNMDFHSFYNNGEKNDNDVLMRIKGNGNVGIGTVNPNSKLHIVNGNLQIGGATNSQYGIKFWRNSMSIGNIDSHGNVFRFAAAQAPNNYQFVLRNSGDVYFNDGQFYLDYSTANIGIGTTTPSAKLHVDNGDNSYGSILANATENNFSLYTKTLNTNINSESFRLGLKYGTDERNGFISFYRGGDTFGGFLGFSTNGLERIRVGINGNVGIGTTNPDAKFVVKVTDSDRYVKFKAPNEEERFKFYVGGTGNPAHLDMYDNDGVTVRTRINTVGNSHFNGGNVGIGTSNPNSKLAVINPNVNDNAISQNTTALQVNTLHFGTDASDGHLYIQSHGSKPLYLNELGNDLILGLNAGDIGVGTNVIPDGYKMAVAGKVITEEVKVQLQSSWPDYVFKKDYNLPTLKDVEKHIKEKGHLKNIPSEEEVSKNGIQLGEMNAKLLQKIEELTLYTIAQEKKIAKQQKEINSLKKISERIKVLEKMMQVKN